VLKETKCDLVLPMRSIALYNLRSIGNTASIIRTASFFGLDEIVMIGTTPHWDRQDYLLPIHKAKLKKQMSKISLGAEEQIKSTYLSSLKELFDYYQDKMIQIAALEQASNSTHIRNIPSSDICVVVGPEATGFTKDELSLFNTVVEIPLSGKKECLNASIAAAIAIYQMTQ
jgi:23S rRNA (guanosine2251-2'-O)-methyltransferase